MLATKDTAMMPSQVFSCRWRDGSAGRATYDEASANQKRQRGLPA